MVCGRMRIGVVFIGKVREGSLYLDVFVRRTYVGCAAHIFCAANIFGQFAEHLEKY